MLRTVLRNFMLPSELVGENRTFLCFQVHGRPDGWPCAFVVIGLGPGHSRDQGNRSAELIALRSSLMPGAVESPHLQELAELG